MNFHKEVNSMLVDRTKSSAMGQIFLVFIATVSSLFNHEPFWCYAYLLGLFAINLLRLSTRFYYRRDPPVNEVNWRWKYAAMTLSTALGWGLLSSQLIVQRGLMDGLSILIFIMVAGLAAGATAVLTPDRKIANAFILMLLVPLLFSLYLRDGFYYLPIQIVIFSNIVFLFAQVKIQHAALWQLISRRNQIRAMEEATMEAIVVHDSGLILEVNKSFERMFLCPASEAKGKNIMDFVPDPNRVPQQLKEYQESMVPIAAKGLKRNGDIFHIEVIGRWYSNEGKRLRVTCIQDTTVRQHAEEAIREREKNALESARLKSEFLANMSHEIRTPLNAIIGITDLVMDTATSDTQNKYFRTLKDSGESLLNLVNDILDFSKLEERKMELEDIQFNLTSAIEGQVSLLSSRAQQKGILLQMLLDPRLPEKVSGDYGRLGQIILNLVSNAIKFTSQGMIFVEAKVLDSQSENVKVRFEVRDTGLGIDAAVQDKLFTAFRQGDNSMARKFGGTGLGLSICSHLVDLMGGKIGVVSEIGKGSNFWFELSFPVISAKPVAQVYREKVPGSYKEFKSVVIQDELPIVDVLSTYLDSWGVSAEFKNINDLLQLNDYDLVIISSAIYEKWFQDWGSREATQAVVIRVENGPLHGLVERGHQVLSMPIRYSDLFNTINEAFGVRELEPEVLINQNGLQFQDSRILVAEDNSTNQMIITALLRQLGVVVHAVHNGQEAIDAFSAGSYDLVLMDCQMPEVDGYAATSEIRRLEESLQTHIPIVALTANVLTEDRERCFACGMDDFLSKPIRKEKLIDVLDKYLGKVAA